MRLLIRPLYFAIFIKSFISVRNLIIFISRYFNFFLFLILEIICLSLVFKNNGYQRTVFLSSSNVVSGFFFKRYNKIESYFHLKTVNDSLNLQNAHLLNGLSQNFTAPDTSSEVRLDSNGLRQYLFYPGQVVNNSVNSLLNYITIYRGRAQGISEGMGVMGPQGIVGIIRTVGENYSVAMSLLHKDTRISSMLSRTGNFGSVQWDISHPDPRYGKLMDIPKNLPVKLGDTIVTSGYSAIFPPGLIIGYVAQVGEENSSSNFHRIRIRFATNFRSLQYVYIVKNLNSDEQHQVEAAVPHE